MKGRVRLHSGGIGTSEVRLARRGASERKTAPGRDIRDIGPDNGRRLRVCRNCNAAFPGPGSYCPSCTLDRDIVSAARKRLKAQNQPGLSTAVGPGAPFGKVRRKAAAAADRLAQRAGKAASAQERRPATTGTSPKAGKPPKKSTAALQTAAGGPKICTRCRLELPATGRCDACAP
jgi:hypothetical protein